MRAPAARPAIETPFAGAPADADLRALLHATAAGDRAAFATLYHRTEAHLFAVALRILGTRQAAEDVLQDAFVNVWNRATSFRDTVDGQTIAPMTWLIAVVRHRALDALRQSRRRPEEPLPDDDSGEPARHDDPGAAADPSALDLLDAASARLGIAECLGQLDAPQRQSLALAYYQGLTHTEAAAQMGAPLGSVKAWIRRGLQRLRDCLDARGLAP